MRLYIIRHADPDYENDTITERGHLEARAVGERMAKVGLTHIYTSPMGRARATAAYTADLVGMEPEVLDWTEEWSIGRMTDLDGRQVVAWNIAGELVRHTGQTPGDDEWHEMDSYADIDVRGRQEELIAGSDAFFAGHGYRRNGGVYEIDEPDEKVVAIFCHGGFGVSFLAHLLALPVTLTWCGFFFAPTAVTTMVMERRSAGLAVPRALTVGDTAHIYAAGLPENLRGIPANAT